jgi:hypothetical protein
MALQIPKEDVAALAAINALPDATVQKLVTAIDSTPLTFDTGEVAERVAESTPSIPVPNLERMLDTLYSLYQIRELVGVSRSTFVEDLMEGMQDKPELAFPKQDTLKIRARFEKLLNIDALNTLSKAGRLQRDGERLYCDAKILSDIRPVFGAKATARPVGAVVSHTLRIGYHKGGKHKEIHIILDAEGLKQLKTTIGRAEAKDKTLRELLKETRLPDLGV